MAQGLSRFAREANWHLLLEGMVGGVSPRGVECDGMLVFHSEQADLKSVARKLAAICPTVLVSGMKPIIAAPLVHEDNVAVGRVAAEHFLARGFRQFFWLSNDSRQVSRDRRVGFLSVLHEAGMPCRCIEWQATDGRQWRENSRWVARQLNSIPRPFALFALDDPTAVDTIEICRDHNIRVPEDAAVLGVGNDSMICDFSSVPLSSIDLGWDEIVYRAAELLEGLISRRHSAPVPLVFPPSHTVTRTSTDILAVSHPYLASALQFVREHFCEPISVRDVARAVGVTRRTLEGYFRRHLRVGLAEEIRRRRLDYARDLLLKTDLSIEEIARHTGFEHGISLTKIFKRVAGTQPARFREQHRRP